MRLSGAILINIIACSTHALALAQTASPTPAPTPENQAMATSTALPEKRLIRPYGRATTQLTLLTSERADAPFFQAGGLRFGTLYDEGLVKGQAIVGIASEQPAAFEVRSAWLGLALQEQIGTTTLKLGRVRPLDFEYWGADGTTYFAPGRSGTVPPVEWGSLVGVHVSQTVAMPTLLLNANLYYGTDLLYSADRQSVDYALPRKAEKGYILTLNSRALDMLSITFSFGAETKMITSKAVKAGETQPADTNNDGKPESVLVTTDAAGQAADFSKLGISAGYVGDAVNTGIWYSQSNRGEAKEYASDGAVGKIKTIGAKKTNKVETTALGIGGNVRSTLFGIRNLLQEGDFLLPGASVEILRRRTDDLANAEKSAEKDCDIVHLAASVGYRFGALDLELGYMRDSAKAKLWSTPGGTPSASTQTVYLWGAVEYF